MSENSDEVVINEDAPVVETEQPEVQDPVVEKPQEPIEPPIPKGVQKRIDRAVRQKYEAEARYKVLEQELNTLKSRVEVAPQGEPTQDKFENYEDFLLARAEFRAEQKVKNTLSEYENSRKVERENEQRNKTVDSWTKRVSSVTAELPDWHDIVESSTDLPLTDHMSQTIMESEFGPKIAYYLAKHPDECADIAELSPLASARAIGRIEERIKSGALSAKTTTAPEPITPVGGKAKAERSISDPNLSDAEWNRLRREQLKRR